jgi:hypothetical protein
MRPLGIPSKTDYWPGLVGRNMAYLAPSLLLVKPGRVVAFKEAVVPGKAAFRARRQDVLLPGRQEKART